MHRIMNAARTLFRRVRYRRAKKFENTYLPLVRSNENLGSDSDYLEAAAQQVAAISSAHPLEASTRILDFGCGQGRFANGLTTTSTKYEHYCGVDADLRAISWCQRWLGKPQNRFEFIHLDAHNERYNPGGRVRPKLPVPTESFDVAFVNSVFSHMTTTDVRYYLAELSRALKDGGTIYLTAFVEENVPDVEENPLNYLEKSSSGPLHRVRYERSFFDRMMTDAGLSVTSFDHQGIHRTGQSVVIGSKATS
jgi:SAM-dependent methyltransferase